jgi:hypothetical protein
MKILVFSNVASNIWSSLKLHGVKLFGVKVQTIFKFARFVIFENIAYVKLGAKVSFMPISIFVVIIALYDLWPIIAYVIENDAL